MEITARHKLAEKRAVGPRYQVMIAIGGDYDQREVIDTHADHPHKRVLCLTTKINADRIAAALNKG